MSYSVLQALAALEASIREFVPLCQFYFGLENEDRNMQPPEITWEVGGGDKTTFERQNAVSGMVSPKSFSADMVQIRAVVMGAAAPSAETTERDQRRQEFAATEHLMCCLRWALMRSSPNGFLGAHEWHGYQLIAPEGPTDRGCIFDCHFAVKVQIVAPEPPLAGPPITETFPLPPTIGA